jgi:hypothetical protein
MPDPIEELQNFNQQGLHVNPLSASEVRRRGDRMRRRNTALAAVGGIAAAVIVIATPLAVVANHDTDSSPSLPPASQPTPSTDQTAWLQKVPAGFPLAEGLSGGESPGHLPGSGPAVADLTFCGVSTWSATSDAPVKAVDFDGVAFRGESEDSRSRVLSLYVDDTAAQRALDAIRAGVEACPQDPNGSGAPLVLDVVPADLAADDSIVFTQQSQMDVGLLADLTVFQVARVGNALYVATQYTSAGGQQVVDAEVQRMAGLSAAVLSDMSIFAAAPGS